jgi:hypothetical protein
MSVPSLPPFVEGKRPFIGPEPPVDPAFKPLPCPGATRKGISKGKVRVALDFMEKVIYVGYRYDSLQPENGKKTCL